SDRVSAMRQPNRRNSGYLLLEVLLSLAVLSIVVVMIFQIVQTTLKVTADIDFLQVQQRKVDGIYELMRRNFDSMPASCLFQTRNAGGSTQLVFRYAPFNFTWAKAGASFGTVIVADRPQADGRIALSILQHIGDSASDQIGRDDDKNADWFPLLSDIERVSWRFFSEQNGKWTTDWPDIGAKPNMVELTFKLAGRNHTDTCIFRWPIAQTGT
ncbi:MAG TPA: type II secretion system protein GspJ, partial [Chthoniobacterales bacterium]